MRRYILLDSGVLGLLGHPQPSAESRACSAWLRRAVLAGDTGFIPEVTDYEIRREYLRRRNTIGISLLDSLAREFTYLPLQTRHWRHAATLWANSLNRGHVTAPLNDLNIDVLLAAQAQLLATPDIQVIIATTNVRHLAPFADSRLWRDI